MAPAPDTAPDTVVSPNGVSNAHFILHGMREWRRDQVAYPDHLVIWGERDGHLWPIFMIDPSCIGGGSDSYGPHFQISFPAHLVQSGVPALPTQVMTGQPEEPSPAHSTCASSGATPESSAQRFVTITLRASAGQ